MPSLTRPFRSSLPLLLWLVLTGLALFACSGDEEGASSDTEALPSSGSDARSSACTVTDGCSAEPSDTTERPTTSLGSGSGREETVSDEPIVEDPDCDSLVPDHCSFPWPSNLYLEEDPARATGYTLAFGPDTLPAALGTRPIDPEPFRRMDGYGLGVPIMTRFPRLDTTGMAREYDIGPSLEADAPVLLFRVEDDTLVRVPYWTELDVTDNSASRRTFIVRPAVILEEASRYIVAFRNLVDTDGDPIPRSPAFQRLLDGTTDDLPVLGARQPRFDEVFSLLDGAGVDPHSLTLAWDFVTASSDALHGPLLTMRDLAFEATGPLGPELTITEVRSFRSDPDDTDDPRSHHADIALEVHATMEVPHFMEQYTAGGTTFWRMHRDGSGAIAQNGWRDANVLIRVPHGALDGTPHGIVTYGHGLLGNRFEIRAGHIGQLGSLYGWIVVGADLAGMSSEDADIIQGAVTDMTHITTMTDRLHQGIVEYLLLTRAARERLDDLLVAEGFGVEVDRESVAYFGGSQGGIFGQTYMAVTQDVRHGYLAVPGTNYSTLLQRSTGFVPFAGILSAVYQTPPNLLTVLASTQLLWDGTDPVSWVRRISNPFDGHDERRALMVLAKADYQVAVSTIENVVRSRFGIPAVGPWDRERTNPPGFEFVDYGHQGSGVILFDFSNPWPNGDNRPAQDAFGDPHSLHSTVPAAGDQLDHFLRFGEVIDVCGGGPCHFPREPRD
ncbi:MAG: hypothetical protein EA398_06920 [Deltaproteobacteria bacterium]|nr:MAG: hypothetical protein EA398_06920 [Deltaproteobacteria bacterium]